VNWDPTATSNRTIVAYIDDSVQVDNLTYTATVITGDADQLLEPGEMLEINVTNVGAVAGIDINANDTFTLEIQPPSGSYMVIERTMPASVAETLINLN
jgi:archaellin